MDDITTVKIGDLERIDVNNIGRLNEFVVNDVLPQSSATKKVTLGELIDFVLKQNLDFSGNVTFINTIQPPATETLDGVFDVLTIREKLIVSDDAGVEGLYINKDAEDVDVIASQLEDGDFLVWSSTENAWVRGSAKELDSVGEAPEDGKCYVRKDGEWVPLDECATPGASGPGASGPEVSICGILTDPGLDTLMTEDGYYLKRNGTDCLPGASSPGASSYLKYNG